jgi:hypothetical protein
MGRPTLNSIDDRRRAPPGARVGAALRTLGVMLLTSLLSCGSTETTEDRTLRLATRVLVPDSLDLDVYGLGFDSVNGPVRCAMFVSRGLRTAGQPEIAIGVAVAEDEPLDFLEEQIGSFYVHCRALARQGQHVGLGGRTVLDASTPLLGRADFRGILYTRPNAVVRELVGPDGLLGVVVTARELEIADQVGHTRLLSRLGEEARFFPTPPWSDRERSEVLTDEHRNASLVDRVPRFAAYRASAWMTLDTTEHEISGPRPDLPDHQSRFGPIEVRLELDPAMRPGLVEALAGLPDSLPLALLTGVSPELSRCLTWSPGRPASAISAREGREDRRCAGNFVLFVSGQERSEVRIVEDGFGLMLRPADWRSVREALKAGTGARVTDGGRTVLDLSWRGP